MLLPLLIQNWSPFVPKPGFTNIELLPIVNITIGVGQDEDLIIALEAFQSDGVSPLLLAGITFTATVTALPHGPVVATLSSTGLVPGIVISSLQRNILTITDYAAEKPWKHGVYSIRLLADDGVYTKEIFALSSITVGPPVPPVLTTVRGAAPRGVLTLV